MKKGFTLVELAIVITIIGLLIGGVLKGQELLENARMTSLGRQLKGYEAALTTFRDIYKGYPGDLAGATNFITGCTAGNNCTNGDGDGVIKGSGASWAVGYNTAECFQAWKHMALAGLITGVDTSVAHTAGSYTGGRDVPTSPFGGQFYVQKISGAQTNAVDAGNGVTTLLAFSKSGTEQVGSTSGLVMPALAQKIDLKLDDGKAFSGDMYSVGPAYGYGCGNNGTGGVNGYDVNSSAKCDMGFTIGQ